MICTHLYESVPKFFQRFQFLTLSDPKAFFSSRFWAGFVKIFEVDFYTLALAKIVILTAMFS